MAVRSIFFSRSPVLILSIAGGTVAKFAGQNVHQRLVKEESYREQGYEEAMKRAFLGTDEDILAGGLHTYLHSLPS